MTALITKRDIAVLVDVYKYRYLSVSQIKHYISPLTKNRMEAVTGTNQLKYLKAFTVAGYSERIFYLDQIGGLKLLLMNCR